LAGQNGVELHKLNFQARNETLSLKKITLLLSAATSTYNPASTSTAPAWTAAQISANYGTVYLYDGSTLLGSGTVNGTNGTVLLAGLNISLPQDSEKILTVKADINQSGTITPLTVVAVTLYSTSTTDMEVQGSQGILAASAITASQPGSLSRYMLFHDAAPTIANALTSGLRTPSTNQEVSKFTITNAAPAGGRTLTLSSLQIVASMSGGSGSSSVATFRLYDDSNTLIATSTLNGTLSAATTPLTLTFATSSVGGTWGSQTIAAGSLRTFTLKADTTNIRTGVGSGAYVYLSTKVDGSVGFTQADDLVGPEYYWNSGGANYSYTQAGGSLTLFPQNTASDSYPADGATLQY
jgi:hypothetical protein